jgi:hypothetical protein
LEYSVYYEQRDFNILWETNFKGNLAVRQNSHDIY